MPQQWMDWQGQTIDGKFELRQYLGESQHSAVFLADPTPPQSKGVALKVVEADAPGAKSRRSHWTEIKKLSHPHLIQLLDTGEFDRGTERYLYAAMEYAEENLSTILLSRPLTLVETQEMLAPMLDVLSYLHAQGFVHGSVKPSNIMAVNDCLKLSSDCIPPMLETNYRPGSLNPFLPPEAVDGKVSTSWDVWGVGMTLLNALTQQTPVFASEVEKEALLRKLPPPFQKIVARCLNSNADKRGTVAEVQSELNLPIVASRQPESVPERAIKRNHLLIPIVGIVVLAIAAGSLLLNHRRAQHDVPVIAVQTPPASATSAPAEPVAATSTNETGKIARQILPDVPRTALRTIHGTVKIKVRLYVDASGEVQKSALISGAANKYFANKALAAARQWKFIAPQSGGDQVASQWDVEFRFSRTELKAYPLQVVPKPG